MRCPKCHTETPPDALNCPGCNLATPRGKTAAINEKNKRGAKKAANLSVKDRYREASRPVGWRVLLPTGGRWIRWVIIAVVVGVGGYGSYWYVYSSSSTEGDPKAALTAMNQLRRLPSRFPGQSIDEAVNAELKKSKESGELVNYQGWTVKANGNSSYLISFSFEEKSGKKSADWLVNQTNNTFIPQSELATAVHK